jgi:hypothetical protein
LAHRLNFFHCNNNNKKKEERGEQERIREEAKTNTKKRQVRPDIWPGAAAVGRRG